MANSKLSLQKAQDELAALLEFPGQDIAKAEAEVTNAKIAITNAREAVDVVKSGPTDEDVAKAESQVDFAGTALDNATRDLSLARKE